MPSFAGCAIPFTFFALGTVLCEQQCPEMVNNLVFTMRVFYHQETTVTWLISHHSLIHSGIQRHQGQQDHDRETSSVRRSSQAEEASRSQRRSVFGATKKRRRKKRAIVPRGMWKHQLVVTWSVGASFGGGA
jgi:hypothetical protein